MSEQKIIGEIKVEPYPEKVEKIQEKILATVNEFVFADFQINYPFHYLYEADIQAHLARKISKNISNHIVFSVSDNETKYRLTPITREYPVGMRHDIVCINPFKVQQYVNWKLEEGKPFKFSQIMWELPLLVGIEIKYSLFGYTLHISKSGTDDRNKLIRYKNGSDNDNKNYHEERNTKIERSNESKLFTDQFKHLSIMFFQDNYWFNDHIEQLDKTSIQQIHEDGIEYDKIYMVGPEKRIFSYSAEH
ncbi:MAG: hypothetical protein AB2L12_14475 [Smithellaceae bacterium]